METSMEKSTYALTEHESFVRELIALYKEKPVLWQKNHPSYRNRNERAKAFATLVKKTQEYYSEGDEDFVRMKIDSMRASFRKERRKVLNSKENCTSPEDVHKPSLWYYELLLFTAGEEAESEGNRVDVKAQEGPGVENSDNGNFIRAPPVWNRKHSALLINYYRKLPCLYSMAHPLYRSKRKRNELFKKITEKLRTATGKFFNVGDIRRKINLLRGQFLYEYKKVKRSENEGEVYKPSLWCYELLDFLKGEYLNQKRVLNKRTDNRINLRRITRRKNSMSEESEDDVDIKKESDSSLSSESVQMETNVADEDIYDTIAKNFAHKLREMNEQQRNFANKIIREVMYHGQMEHLTDSSRFSLDGT